MKHFWEPSACCVSHESPRARCSVCSFPQTLFGRWTPSFRTPVLRNSELAGLSRIFRDHHADKCVLHSESPGLDMKGQVAAQPSARHQCPPEELVLLLQLLPWGRHLLTTSDSEEWEQFPVCVSLTIPFPLLLSSPWHSGHLPCEAH